MADSSKKMQIVFASAECAPFVKTGGLGDVAGSLPAALVRAGAEVIVMVPKYATIKDEYKAQMEHFSDFYVSLGWRNEYCGLEKLEHDGVTYMFIDNERYFARDYPYGFFDDGERFAFFSKAITESLQHLPAGFECDILHCNDWQTALAPVFLREFYQGLPLYDRVKTVFSIHTKNSFESGKPYEKEPEQILIDSTAILNCLCELAQKYGIGIGVEVIGSKRSSIRTVRQVNSLFKTVNYPNLGYVLDPYNLFTYDKTLTFDSILEADPTRIFAAHINQSEEDLPIHLLCKENRSLCDRGVMNIDRYMKNLQTIGYDGPVSIEVFPKDYWEDDAEWIVSECYKTTKAFMEMHGLLENAC